MEQPSPGPAPTDAYQWRESVLSTRSLSYITVVDDMEMIAANGMPTPASPRRVIARNASYTFPNFSHTRRNTLMSISSLGEDEETLEIGSDRRHQLQSQTLVEKQAEEASPDRETTPSPEEALPSSIASSPLFRLPRELRQLIWSYALSPSESSIEVPWPSTRLTSHLQPQLLRTCKPIYHESAEILYTTTNLSFAHPSDANMFRRALADQTFAQLLPHFTLRIKSSDAKLWTSYFNSHSPERSLVRDFPSLQSLTIRWQGLRYDRRYTEEQNAHLWLKDSRLQEALLAVRKCSVDSRGGPPVVRVTLCVVLPEDIKKGLAEGSVDATMEAERCNSVIFCREAWLLGCFVHVEAVEKDSLLR